MKKINSKIFITFFIFIISFISFTEEIAQYPLTSKQSLYYEEKYFRLLSNNYETIDQGNTWSILSEEDGIGFKAKKDFGSAIILKDWSMYNFKLTKIIFRPYCTIQIEDKSNCDAEMWLYHTKDNSYYSPGRRIYLKDNYFVLIVPFKKVDNNHPSVDSLFKFFNLKKFSEELKKRQGGSLVSMKEISPVKSVKLHQIIQNQPAYMFESTLLNSPDYLFMVFSQYHFISEEDYETLNEIYTLMFDGTKKIQILGADINDEREFYRNYQNSEEVKPKATLMSYNKANYFRNNLVFVIYLFFLLL